MTFAKENYEIKDKVLVFRPNSDSLLINEAKRKGFNTILLDSSNDSSWTFDYDAHWNCYGHEKAAIQVSDFLKLILISNYFMYFSSFINVISIKQIFVND